MKISVKAKASAREDRIEEIGPDDFVVSTTEPPIQGRANEAITAQLADHFGVTKSDVLLVSGFRSRNKIFEITSIRMSL
jgi:hypothetical protein